MGALGVTFIAGIIAIPAAMVVVMTYMVVSDYKDSKEQKYFDQLIEKCKKVNGISFTHKLLDRCVEARLPMKNIISILERHCQAQTEKPRESNQKPDIVKTETHSRSSLKDIIASAKSIADQPAKLTSDLKKHKSDFERE